MVEEGVTMSMNDAGNVSGTSTGGSPQDQGGTGIGGSAFGQVTDENRLRDQLATTGNEMFDKAKELFAWGNARRVVVSHDGRTMVQFPLTVGVIATVLAPQLVALGIIAAILSGGKIEVHHQEMTS